MLKEHPKGLFVALFANMGERFGYYTMLAIFVLFLQAKYGFDYEIASQYFGIFLAFVYFMPLIGGIVADKFLGYGKTITLGLVVMFLGYVMLAIPTKMDGGLALVIGALAVISIGTGFFKGNLQALVGNMYDDPKYSKNRDVGFNIFYMGINIGAMFAPTAAGAISNWILKGSGYFYKADIPALAHKFLNGHGGDLISSESAMTVQQKLTELATAQGVPFSNLTEFSTNYINALSESYHWAFGVATISLIISMLIFKGFKKYYKKADITEKQKAASEEHKNEVVELSPEQTKERLIALGLVFFVVIFFWMAFHQNGAAMTAFARDYVVDHVGKYTYIAFDLFGLLSIFAAVIGAIFVFKKSSSSKTKLIGGITSVVFLVLAYYRIDSYSESNVFTPQMFQHFNPFFIVALTPVIVGFFNWLRIKGKEPSAPKKIGIGMFITAGAFIIMLIGSLSLIGYAPGDIGEIRAPENVLVSTNWLIGTYLTLTIAELFLSPMGISFVSKVAPPKYKGLMQGGWLAATAVGNYAVALVGFFWNDVQLWVFWGILVVFATLSGIFIFSILKKLENATK
ncbi:MAG: MFS transporter [Bacteroidetes bacterium]|nr:MAG: MFS transporter [Bacteroidota bacterium]